MNELEKYKVFDALDKEPWRFKSVPMNFRPFGMRVIDEGHYWHKGKKITWKKLGYYNSFSGDCRQEPKQ